MSTVVKKRGRPRKVVEPDLVSVSESTSAISINSTKTRTDAKRSQSSKSKAPESSSKLTRPETNDAMQDNTPSMLQKGKTRNTRTRKALKDVAGTLDSAHKDGQESVSSGGTFAESSSAIGQVADVFRKEEENSKSILDKAASDQLTASVGRSNNQADITLSAPDSMGIERSRKTSGTTRSGSSILSQLGLDGASSPNQMKDNDEGAQRREARQIEFVELMIQSKRKKLVQSLTTRVGQVAEDQITIATLINDLRLSQAAGEIVSIATEMHKTRSDAALQQRQQQQARGTSIPQSAGRPITTTNSSPTSTASSTIKLHSTPSQSTSRQGRIPPMKTQNPTIAAAATQHPPISTSTQPTPVPNPRPRLPQSLPNNPPSPFSSTWDQRTSRRPTQLSYEELKKHPDFKRLSWSWTGLIVGIPVLLATSWALYKEYDQRMAERKMASKNLSSSSTSTSSSSSNSV